MPYILKNNNIQITIDLPGENYKLSRFDHTGKITEIWFNNILVSGVERTDCDDYNKFGKALYNEFGNNSPLGYVETKLGGWFHKIGVGLLKKDDDEYIFNKDYNVKPGEFIHNKSDNMVTVNCMSHFMNGYSYLYKKEIELFDNNFSIKQSLSNTGLKNIETDEYNHNFIAINNEEMGSNYILKFPFNIKPELFTRTVNNENKVIIKTKEITFNGTPSEDFYFGNLTGNENVEANWELINTQSKIAISETCNFRTNKINLWGRNNVISPEIFFKISLKPSESVTWERVYNVYKTEVV